MRARNLARVLWAAAAIAAGSTPLAAQAPLPVQCAFNSDCAGHLVCARGTCREQCRSDRDCAAGWRCHQAPAGFPHQSRCVPPARPAALADPGAPEPPAMCVYDADCVNGTCAADGQCKPKP